MNAEGGHGRAKVKRGDAPPRIRADDILQRAALSALNYNGLRQKR